MTWGYWNTLYPEAEKRSPRGILWKKVVLEISQNSQEGKVAGLLRRYFPVDFAKFIRTPSYRNPVATSAGRQLNVFKTFRRRPGRLLNVFCTFNLPSVSKRERGKKSIFVRNKTQDIQLEVKMNFYVEVFLL